MYINPITYLSITANSHENIYSTNTNSGYFCNSKYIWARWHNYTKKRNIWARARVTQYHKNYNIKSVIILPKIFHINYFIIILTTIIIWFHYSSIYLSDVACMKRIDQTYVKSNYYFSYIYHIFWYANLWYYAQSPKMEIYK